MQVFTFSCVKWIIRDAAVFATIKTQKYKINLILHQKGQKLKIQNILKHNTEIFFKNQNTKSVSFQILNEENNEKIYITIQSFQF